MSKFDESKVINALHPEKAVVGKTYYFSDYITYLKKIVEEGNGKEAGELERIENNPTAPFIRKWPGYENIAGFCYLYPRRKLRRK